MSERMDLVGGNKGVAFDDGVFDGVKKIIVGEDVNNGCVSYIKIEYEKDGKFETREHGKIRGELKEYAVDYPNEYIISVGGSYDDVGGSYDTVMVKSLIFRTSCGKTSPILGTTTYFGYLAGKEFRIEGQTGGKLLGIHGRSGDALNAIGATFYAVSPSIKHFSLQGGDGGGKWDDGAYDGVRKILVGLGDKYVSYVRFEYAKGQGMISHDHGTRQDVPEEFVVDYPNEHITLVEGTIDDYVTSLQFKTSKGRTSPAFGNVVGRKFVFEEKDFRLVGFCGRSGKYIDALGANFGPLPVPASTKMGPLGGTKGNTFDDGVFEGVKKITVGVDEYSVTYIKIEYEKYERVETREHGTARGELKEFLVDYPNENIIAVGGSYNHIFNYDTTLVTSLYFTLSNGRTSPKFGKTSGTEFAFKGENEAKILGFHGRGGDAIDAIGAYFEAGSGGSQKVEPKGGSGGPQKVEPQGGKGGNQWDDGADLEGVAKIEIAAGGEGIEFIKFDYVKNGKTKEGPIHGVKASGSISTIVINHPDEYLVSVYGWFNSSSLIEGIQFKTNTKTSAFFGDEFAGDGTQFALQVKDKKIIGFLGFADTHLNSLGAYFAPISSSST